MSKLNVTDMYYYGTLQPSQMGVFAYVVPSAPDDDVIIICIDLVLPMRWVVSPKFSCALSETLTDGANNLFDADLPVPAYGAVSAIQVTDPPPPIPRRASPIYTVIWMTASPRCKVGSERQHRVFDSTVRALKWIFPSLPGEAKDSVSVKKLLAGEGDWESVK